MDTGTFVRMIAAAHEKRPIKKLLSFKGNGRDTVILGMNALGEHWRKQLDNLGVSVAGVCSYQKNVSGGGTLDFATVLARKCNVVICSLDYDADSQIAHILADNGNEYVDFTYVVNNRFVQHYDIDLIVDNLAHYYDVYEALADELSRQVLLSLLEYRITRDPLRLLPAAYPQYFHTTVRALPGDTVMEAGGFDGCSAIPGARSMSDKGRVIAFEPNPKNLQAFQTNLQESGLKSVETVPLGLWKTAGTLRFQQDDSATIVNDQGEIAVPVTTIDDYVNEHRLYDDGVDLIRLDVEGSEMACLEGGRGTIAAFHPKLQISVYHKPDDIWQLFEYIKAINPRYKFYLGHHTKFIGETVLYAIE